MTNPAPVTSNELANRIYTRYQKGADCYTAAHEVLNAAATNGEIQLSRSELAQARTFAEIQARGGVTVRRPGRLPVIRAAVGALVLILSLPPVLWLVGHGLLPLYSWGLSWLR